MKEAYTKKEVAEITGIPYRNVQFYTEQGVVTPEIDSGEGRGRFRRYSTHDLISFTVAGELAYYGMTVSEIRNTIRVLDHFWNLKEDLYEDGKPKKKPDAIETLSKMSIVLRIGKTRDKIKVTQLTFGIDNQGKPIIQFSIVSPPDGEKILHLQNNRKSEGPYTITMDENQKEIENYDLEALLKNDLVSFVYISVDQLLVEALKRMP